MTSKPVALLLADLGVVNTHSRPHVSNDNPFSEAQSKTLEYCPQFPERFRSLDDGRAFGHGFFDWYNNAHHHNGLGFLTPAVVHFGQAATVRGSASSRRPRRRIPSASSKERPNLPISPRRSGSTYLREKKPLRMP